MIKHHPASTLAKTEPSTHDSTVTINARFGNLQKETDEVRHTPQQQSAYNELAGRYTYTDIAAAMTDPEWGSLSPEEKRKWVDDIKEGARRAAREDLGRAGIGAASRLGSSTDLTVNGVNWNVRRSRTTFSEPVPIISAA